MPKKYEVLRDKFRNEGLTLTSAKTKAARIYNAQRKPGQRSLVGKDRYGKKKR